MKLFLFGGFCFLVLGAASLPAIDYYSIDAPGVVVTGVRSTSALNDDVIVTASYTTGGVTSGAIYSGSLAALPNAPSWGIMQLSPSFDGQTVTSTSLYGPNTSRYTPSIGAGNVIAVGSYKYAEGASGAGADHGVIYQGSTVGDGVWTQIDATPLASGCTLLNTIAHSTMGDIVVGNYDTDVATGNAFIYNMATDTWTNLNPAGSASVTAYGIWQTGTTTFTITGGLSDVNSGGGDEGYLVDYDSSTGFLSHYKTFNYNNEPLTALVSHFNGITATETGFNLAGDYLVDGGDGGAFFASVEILPDGSFSDALWTDIAFPGADVTSGNTVVENNVLGIYSNSEGTLSYIATVPEPSTYALFGLGAVLLILWQRRKVRL